MGESAAKVGPSVEPCSHGPVTCSLERWTLCDLRNCRVKGEDPHDVLLARSRIAPGRNTRTLHAAPIMNRFEERARNVKFEWDVWFEWFESISRELDRSIELCGLADAKSLLVLYNTRRVPTHEAMMFSRM